MQFRATIARSSAIRDLPDWGAYGLAPGQFNTPRSRRRTSSMSGSCSTVGCRSWRRTR